MNLLGKILIVLVFVMSTIFMAFSFMVYMTHTNWKEVAGKAQSDVRQAQDSNRQLQQTIELLKKQRAAENAARTTAIQTLESRSRSGERQLQAANQELLDLRSQARQAEATIAGALKTLEDERSKVAALRETVQKAENERDQMFQDVVQLKGQVLELEATRRRLESREKDILNSLARAKTVLRANDLTEFTDITNVPPPRQGEVQDIRNNKYVLLTLGSDDGIQESHQLEVFRGPKYLGRVEVTRAEADRSVGRILDDYRKGAIRVGDGVRTK